MYGEATKVLINVFWLIDLNHVILFGKMSLERKYLVFLIIVLGGSSVLKNDTS